MTARLSIEAPDGARMSKKPVCLLVALAMVGCHERPPALPDEVRMRAELVVEVKAATEREQRAEEALQTAEATEQAAKGRLAAFTAGSDDAALAAYRATIAEAQAVSADCTAPFERLVELHERLRVFASEPQRDAAIVALERCRKLAHAARQQAHAAAQVELRREFALAVEAEFDAENPGARGQLVATVKGAVLHVQLRGHVGWRPRDCEARVQEMCASTPHFRSIVLSGPDGRFTCRPPDGPGAYVAEKLRLDGLAERWVPVNLGVAGTPQAKPPIDPVELARLRRELVGATHGREAAAAALKHVKGADRELRERIHDLDRVQQSRKSEWQEHREQRYRNMTLASIGPGTLGVAMSIFTAVQLQNLSSIRRGDREFASPAEYEAAKQNATRGTLFGAVIALPALAVGLTLLVVGVRGARVVRRISVAGDGVLVRF